MAASMEEAVNRINRLRMSQSHKLDMENIGISEIPDVLFEAFKQGYLPPIQELLLQKNKLTSLPPFIGNLGANSLIQLHLYDNQLTTLPNEIGMLVHLKKLVLDRNHLQQLPRTIANLTQLTWLSADNNQLETLPPEIGQLASLETLYLSHNRLRSLPFEIGMLSNLKELTLDKNRFEEFPVELQPLIATAPTLALSLSHNDKIKIIPSYLPPTIKLKVDHKEYLLPSDLIKQGSDALVTYLSTMKVLHIDIDPKAHWVPDSASNKCQNCGDAFTAIHRRHHCRLCGRLLCKKCASESGVIPFFKLDKSGPQRLCKDCHAALKQKRTSQTASASATQPRPEDREWGLVSPADDLLSPVDKVRKLDGQHDELSNRIRSLKKTQKELKKLFTLYAADTTPDGVKSREGTAKEVAELDMQIARLEEALKKVGVQLDQVKAAMSVSTDDIAPPNDPVPPPPPNEPLPPPPTSTDDDDAPPEYDAPPPPVESEAPAVTGEYASYGGVGEAPESYIGTVRALFDFYAGNETELSFKEGENILLIEKTDDEWWYGWANGYYGYFPRSYVAEQEALVL